MRIRRTQAAAVLALAAMLLAPAARAQNPDTMDPEASAAKGRALLKQLVETLGGQRYLGARGIECQGRRAQFGHNGDLMGFAPFKDYWIYPDKRRTEYGKKGNVVDMFTGDQGWTLDRGGVSEEPATAGTDFQEAVKRDANNLLRYRLKENGVLVRYGGSGIVDLKPVDWVEVTDAEERTYRLAIERSTHLLIRSVVTVQDEETRERRDEATVYSNYQLKDGLQVPMQVSRERDGRRTYQAFYEECRVNPPLAGDFFTKESLEKRFAELGGKRK